MSGTYAQTVRQRLLDQLAREPRAIRGVAQIAKLRVGDIADFALDNYTDALPIDARINDALRAEISVAPGHGDRARARLWAFLAGPHGDPREIAHSTGISLTDIADWLAEVYAGPIDVREAIGRALDRIDATWAQAEAKGDAA